MSGPPNVLFLIDDQHRPDVLGYAGNDVVHTPTIDRLADRGITFTNAYTPSPTCVPARHAIRSGKLPLTYGQDGHEAFESFEYPTLPRRFSRYGYDTVNAGQVHYPGENIMQGWRKQLGPTPWGFIPRGVNDVADDAYLEDERPFHEYKWSDAKEIRRAGVGKPQSYSKDRRSVEGALEFLRYRFHGTYYDRHQPDVPLLLKVAPNRPHLPFMAASEERFEYYLNRVDPFVEPPTDIHPSLDGRHPVEPGEDVLERDIQRATAAYYAMAEEVDERFGQVIDAIEHGGEDLSEWIVVFTADHGEMLGEHGVWQKSTFFEASARVPLVISFPDRFDPGTVDANVSLVDLYATLCELADIPVPESTDSRSLVPLMEGDRTGWSNEAISQYPAGGSFRTVFEIGDLMIKQDHLKYCYYEEHGDEVLFDLEDDPDETTDCAGNARYADAMDRFRERRGELGFGPNADPAYTDAGYHD